MSEMVERVARALLASLRPAVMYLPESPESVLVDGYVDLAAAARAAIEALMEPTEEMVKAGIESVEACTDGWSARAACAAEHAYEAMLQAALSPPEQVE